MSVKLELKVNKLVDKFETMPEEVQRAMIDELRLTGFMIETNYKIAVPVVTSRLQTSIHTEHSDINSYNYSDRKGNTYNGYIGYNLNPTQVIIGTNVEYASVIENGFSGSVTIKPHTRLIKKAFGKSISPREIQVSGHNRQMERRGNNALKEAFNKETAGLPARLAKLIK